MASLSPTDSDDSRSSFQQRRGLLVLLAVPALTFVIVGGVGIARAVPNPMAVRVFGGPSAADGVARWRIGAVRFSHGLTSPVTALPVTLTVTSEADRRSVTVRGVTDEQGGWDASVPIAVSRANPAVVSISESSSGRVLARSRIAPSVRDWHRSWKHFPPKLPGSRRGPLHIEAWSLRGVFATSFFGQVLLKVTQGSEGPAVKGVRLHFSGGAISATPDTALTDDYGLALARITPKFSSPLLEVDAVHEGQSSHWEGLLPTVSGVPWLDPIARDDGTRIVRASAGQPVLYAHLVDESSILGAWRLPMKKEPDGSSFGVLSGLPAAAGARRWLVLSSFPPEIGGESERLGWALAPSPRDAQFATRSEAIQMQFPALIDGLPDAVRKWRQAQKMNRFVLLAILALGSLVELVFVWLHLRRDQRAARRWAEQQRDIEDVVAELIIDKKLNPWYVMIGATLISVMFLLLAWISWLRID